MLVTLEGIEGSGKSTVIEILAESLRARGMEAVVTREPGGSGLGSALRRILLGADTGNLSPKAELFLFLADRAQHMEELIKPALKRGAIVLCDRYSDSTLAYQGGGRNFGMDELGLMCAFASDNLTPDLTLLLDLPVRAGLGRALQRNHFLGRDMNESRFDTESLDFHERAREAYLALAKKHPERIVIINAANSLERVAEDCIKALDDKLQKAGGCDYGKLQNNLPKRKNSL